LKYDETSVIKPGEGTHSAPSVSVGVLASCDRIGSIGLTPNATTPPAGYEKKSSYSGVSTATDEPTPVLTRLVVVVVDDGADPYSGPDASTSSIKLARVPPVSIELDWTSVDVTCKATAFHEYSQTIADCAPEGTIGPELVELVVAPGKSPCGGHVGPSKGSSVVGIVTVVGIVVGELAGVFRLGETTVVGTWTVEEEEVVEGKGAVEGGVTAPLEGGDPRSGLRLTAGSKGTVRRTSAPRWTELPPRCAARNTMTTTATTATVTRPIH
jgi:hypothetical protein